MTALQAWSQKLRQRLSSGSFYLQNSEGVKDLEFEGSDNLWVIGRALCVFRTLSLEHIPKSKINAVIDAQVALLSPYRNPGYWYCVQCSIAKIWIWDESLRLKEVTEITKAHTVIPEPCIAPKMTSGQYLYETRDGFLAHVWEDEALVADAWWPVVPSDADWKRFTRGLGVDSDIRPESLSLSYTQPRLWEGIGTTALSWPTFEAYAVRCVGFGFLLLFGFQATGSIRLLQQSMHLDKEILNVARVHKESIEMRTKAFASRSHSEQLAVIWPHSQLSLIKEVASALPDNEGLMRWQVQRNELEFVVADFEPNLEAYVRSAESVPRLTGVRVEPLRRAAQIRVNAEVAD